MSAVQNSRLSFAKIPKVLDIPDLLIVQKDSFKWFIEEGLNEILEEIYSRRNQDKIQLVDKNDYYLIFEISNVNKKILNAMRRDKDGLTTLRNKQDAFQKGKRVMVTIPNPNTNETNKRFIRVTAQEAGWRKQMPIRMKLEG